MRGRSLVFVTLTAMVWASACTNGGNNGRGTSSTATVMVDAPFSLEPAVAREIARGAELAAGEINDGGGVHVGDRRVRITIEQRDSRLSPSQAVDNARRAHQEHAAAVVTEGTGATEAAAVDRGLPVAIVYRGDAALVDRARDPNVFRIAPTNRGVAFRLAEYIIPKGKKIGVVHDDSGYGAGGGDALDRALASNRDAVAGEQTVPSGADPAPQVRALRDAGATALIVWARAATVAAVVRSVRQSGWSVPLFSAPSAEDPIVRQQLADHAVWLDGMTVAMSRLTSEKGVGPFERFRAAYEHRFGRQLVGVQSGGKPVVQAPDWAMYSYDFVRLLAAAMVRSGVTTAHPKLVAALEQVEVQGANGDERGFNERNHEGVVDDDVFFASLHDMILVPVKDDALSASLPPIPQT